MKIGVITVYNGMNSGSFWQAYALKYILEKMGNEVYFLDRKGEGTASKFYQIGKVIKTSILHGFGEGINKFKSYSAFLNEQKIFKIVNNYSLNHMSCVIIGSDTVWNMESKHFRNNYRIYWGINIENKNINTYACSVGNTTYNQIMKYVDIQSGLKKMNKISVRDIHTYNLVKKIVNKEIELVCDPTLLLEKKDYVLLAGERIEQSKYIFLYLFEDLSQKHIEQLIKFARDNKLLIISGFEGNHYCDKAIINTPKNFLNYMLYADYIITDTFHGNVFSVNLKKEFVSIDRNKTKVADFLNAINLEYRLIDKDENILNFLEKKIIYTDCSDKIEFMRKKSLSYLLNVVEERNESYT